MTHVRLSAPRRFLLSFLLSALTWIGDAARAQVPVGRWELIAPGTSASRLVEADNKLYVAGDYGLFRYDLTDNTVRPLSKQDGLADVRVAAMAYDSTTGLVVIGYRDTNVDLLDPRSGAITNVPDIQRRTIIGSKLISSITTFQGRAYVACSFGIVVLDLRRVEVADTYLNLGRTGQTVEIQSVAIQGDSILASTNSEGIITGLLSQNLLDYRRWTPMAGTDNIPAIAVFNRRFYAARNGVGLLRLTNGVWNPVPGVAATDFDVTSLTAARGQLVIAHPNNLFLTVLRADGTTAEIRPTGLGRVPQGQLGRDGQYFLADLDNGLRVSDGSAATPTVIAPNGPHTDVSFATAPGAGADMYAFAGGYSSGTGGPGRRIGFSHRQGGQWRAYTKVTVPDSAYYPAGNDADLSDAVWNPVNQKLYIASYGNGLIEWSGPDAPFRRYSVGNSPFIGTAGLGEGYLRLTSVAVDAAGLVWTTNFHQEPGEPSLFSFDPAATANPFKEYLRGVSGAETAHQVVIDDSGNKWVSCFPSRVANGIYGLVFNETTNTSRQLTAAPANGGLLGPIYAIAKDRKGDIWVGTSKGVQVFSNTGAALPPGNNITGRQPIIDRRPLLDNQIVKVIAVDGANRKWIGTDDGLYLFGEDGDEAIAHFTAENSPLPSNVVNSLSINGTTGEVFIGTDNGLVSYRGSATEPTTEEKPACTTIFPNPVPARFTGQIAIDGLTGGATVKITDVAGQLVYETTANGSRAVWDARDYNGRRVRTGIYLAYAANADGQNTCVSKIAVMGE